MAHRERFMALTAGGWIVSCRHCGHRQTRRRFQTAKECHDYWREHSATEMHQRRTSREMREEDWRAFIAGCVEQARGWGIDATPEAFEAMYRPHRNRHRAT